MSYLGALCKNEAHRPSPSAARPAATLSCRVQCRHIANKRCVPRSVVPMPALITSLVTCGWSTTCLQRWCEPSASELATFTAVVDGAMIAVCGLVGVCLRLLVVSVSMGGGLEETLLCRPSPMLSLTGGAKKAETSPHSCTSAGPVLAPPSQQAPPVLVSVDEVSERKQGRLLQHLMTGHSNGVCYDRVLRRGDGAA